MKKITSLMLLLGAGVMAFSWSSCRKYESEPKDWFTSALTFDSLDQNAVIAGFDLNNIYTYLPNGFDRIGGDFLDDGAGEALPSRFNTVAENYTQGTINLLNNPDPYWSSSYYGIRRATIFLKNIDRVPVAALTKRYWKAEARWLRAFFYWELLKRYGGVPLLGDTLFTLDQNIEIPRNSFAQTVDYIVNECSVVKDSLRPEPISEYGRVPRAAAVALKCRVLLYAASPLFNGGGFETDVAKKALTGYPTYDATRWQRVVDACTEFNALGFYTLITGGTSTSFASIYTTKVTTASEVIFAKNIPNNTSLEVSQSPVGYVTANTRSLGYTSPTQGFVNSFLTSKGGYITEDVRTTTNTTGYDSTNPYANRDPRLAATVFYNGLPWLNRNVQTYEGGLDKPNNPAVAPVQTRTGYYLRKFLGNFATSNAYSNQNRVFPIFRYSEILLNWAEALNEVGQPEAAVAQIIRIRQRAGITAGTNSRYGIKAGITQTEMRILIQNERRIELAFEEHRFWDIRRWKIAPQVLDNTSLYGMKITNNGTVSTYQTIPVANASWANPLYHMPIPYDEITKNTKLIQNEGW